MKKAVIQIGNKKTTAVLLGIFLLLSVTVTAVFAHAVPERLAPRANEILEESPAELSITFNEPVVPSLSQIRVLTQAGEEVAVGPLRSVDETDITLAVDLPPLNDGAYLVSWQVLSTVDGHTTSGTYSFGVGVTELTAVSEDVTVIAQLSPMSAAARWLTLTAVALLIGLFAFRLMVWNPIVRNVKLEPAEEQLDINLARTGLNVGWVALGLLVVSLVLIFIDQSSAYNLFQPGNVQTWIGTRFGTMWLLRLFLTAGIAFILADLRTGIKENGRDELRGWEWWFGLFLAVGLGLTSSLISHSAALTEDTLLATAVDLGHILAAGLWAGGLLFLVIALHQSRHLPAEARTWLNLSLILNFSALAALSVGILIASGTYLAWQHIGNWTALVGTAYGRALLIKLSLALVAFAVAAINLLYVKPRLDDAYAFFDAEGDEPTTVSPVLRRFRHLVGAEAALALLILLAAGILTDLQRGEDAPLLADASGKTVVTQPVEDLNIEMTIEPALVGQNTFDVYVTDDEGNPVTDASQVSIRYTFLGQSIGAAMDEAISQGDGHYVLEGSYISLIGPWQAEVTVRRPDAFDTFAPFRLEAGIGGNIRPLDSSGRPLERFANFMTLAGSLATGAFLVLFGIGWGFLAVKAAKTEWHLVSLLAISLVGLWLGASQLIDFFTVEFTPAKFLNNPELPDAESIAIGEGLFQENCVPCHGPMGRGDGPIAPTLNPPPADYGAGHTDTHPDGDIYYWIREGLEQTAMPAFGDKLTTEETWHLVNYVRRLSALAAQEQAEQSNQSQ